MLIRITIQLIYTGILIGLVFYKKDNNIPNKKSEPCNIWFWVIQGMVFPITFMWLALIGVLSEEE